MKLPEVLKRITTALDRSGVSYMLTGSFASAYYGAARSTQDIDLVIAGSMPQLRNFVESLSDKQYYSDLNAAMEAYQRESMFNVIDLESGWKVDFIIRKSRAFSQEEFRRRRMADIQGTPFVVAAAEDVVIAKLEWAKRAQSQRQIEDAAAIMRIQAESLDRAYLAKWVGELGLAEECGAAQRLAGGFP